MHTGQRQTTSGIKAINESLQPNDDLQHDATMPLGKMTYRSRKTATTLRISFWTIRVSRRLAGPPYSSSRD